MSEKLSDFKKELNFDSDTFSDMKRDLTFVLQRLLGNMQEKTADEGSLNLKLEVKLEQGFVPCIDDNGKNASRKIEKPKFKHKITSTLQIKDEKTGNLDTEMELVFDEESGEYVMKPIANTTQRSIFDSDFQEAMKGDESPEDEIDETALPGGARPELPGPVAADDDVIDGDFKEVDADIEDVTDELIDGNDTEEDQNDDQDSEWLDDPDDPDEPEE